MRAFRQGLTEAGFVEGQNVTIESLADGQGDRLPSLAADLVRLQVDLIVAHSNAGKLLEELPLSGVSQLFSLPVDQCKLIL